MIRPPRNPETFPDLTAMIQIYLSYQFLYALTSPLVKISIILFYRRIFITPRFIVAANIMIALCAAWGFSVFIATAFMCRPLRAYWGEGKGQCYGTIEGVNIPTYILASQIPNIFLDFAILCMPISMVWNLRMPKKEKIALIGVFLLGIL